MSIRAARETQAGKGFEFGNREWGEIMALSVISDGAGQRMSGEIFNRKCEAGNIRFGLEMRRQRGGDGGVAVHVLADVGGSTQSAYVEETEILAFDCFWDGPHYHYGPRNKNHRTNWDLTVVDDPLEWTFEQLESGKLPAMIERAGYPGVAADLDREQIAALLPTLKKRAFEMYEEGERLTGHKGLPLEVTPNLAAAE